MQNLSIQYGYFGIFLISLIGALSVFFPIPYTVVIFALGGLKVGEAWVFEPLWIAVAAGIGSAVGEFSGYLIGFGGRKVIGEKYKKKMEFLMKLFDKFGPIIIFLFALTPLPVAIALLVIVFVIMFKVDWEKFFEKYVTKEEGGGEKNEGDS